MHAFVVTLCISCKWWSTRGMCYNVQGKLVGKATKLLSPLIHSKSVPVKQIQYYHILGMKFCIFIFHTRLWHDFSYPFLFSSLISSSSFFLFSFFHFLHLISLCGWGFANLQILSMSSKFARSLPVHSCYIWFLFWRRCISICAYKFYVDGMRLCFSVWYHYSCCLMRLLIAGVLWTSNIRRWFGVHVSWKDMWREHTAFYEVII